MSELEVRIERLAAMRVARFRSFGLSPESEAWSKLRNWAESRGLLKNPTAHPVFGFNNPGPSPGRAEYGYEFWIRLGAETRVESSVETLDFPGGWYAVTTCRGFPNPDLWMRFLERVRGGPQRYRRSHELERPHNPLGAESEMVFELYLPIEEPEDQT